MAKISVIIPAYNKARLTVETVESVLAQTYKNIEVIVVDDGSTDDTRKCLEPYFTRIRYIYKKNSGACSARNQGLRLSSAEYVGFLDCDDIYLPQKVEHCVKYLEEHPDCGFVHTAAYFIDGMGRIVSKYSHPQSRRAGWVYRRLLNRNFICNSTVIARRSCFGRAGVFDEKVFTPADWDMWLRLAKVYPLGYIDEPLTKYRVSASFIFANLDLAEKEELQVINKAFRFSPEIKKRERGKILSNIHRRFAMNYFLNNKRDKARQRFKTAFGNNIFDFKTVALYLCFLLAPGYLRILLKKRILLEA